MRANHLRVARFPVCLLAMLVAMMPVQPAQALERFDFDQKYLVDPGFIVKDHSIITASDGTHHIFYIKADLSLPESRRAKALGHATSTDLAHWTFHPDVIPVVPNTWEESFIWAPQVIAVAGQYYMFYTGVNRFFAQATGVATSLDLFNWAKEPSNPVYIPSTSWAAWSSTTWSNCRDPFVFREAGNWFLLTTTHTTALKGSISFATSTDLIHWVDLGPLLVHPGPSAWHVLESPNMHFVHNSYHLFFTEENVGGTSYLAAPATAGPWDFNARVNTFDQGHAPEIVKVDGQWRLSRHWAETIAQAPFYVIKIDNLNWDQPGMPVVTPTSPLDDWTVVSGNAFDVQPTFWDNSLERGSSPSNFLGNSWLGTYESFTGHLQVGLPGDVQGELPTGVIRSRIFRLTGNRIAFRIAGTLDPDRLYIALYTSDNGIERLRATGSGNNLEAMATRTWDVSPWLAERVFLEIADLSMTGHINVDEIVEFLDSAPPTDATDRGAPGALTLHGNTPNPFNPTTAIEFSVPAAGEVQVEIFDVTGRLVRTLAVGGVTPGRHQALWDGRGSHGDARASGIYFYRLRLDQGVTDSRSMALIR